MTALDLVLAVCGGFLALLALEYGLSMLLDMVTVPDPRSQQRQQQDDDGVGA